MHQSAPYHFSSKVWKHPPANAWHFVSLPMEISKEIRSLFQWQEEGWGRLKAVARIQDVQWDTAIWYDTKQDTYLLPLKSVIRKKCKIQEDDLITVSIHI